MIKIHHQRPLHEEICLWYQEKGENNRIDKVPLVFFLLDDEEIKRDEKKEKAVIAGHRGQSYESDDRQHRPFPERLFNEDRNKAYHQHKQPRKDRIYSIKHRDVLRVVNESIGENADCAVLYGPINRRIVSEAFIIDDIYLFEAVHSVGHAVQIIDDAALEHREAKYRDHAREEQDINNLFVSLVGDKEEKENRGHKFHRNGECQRDQAQVNGSFFVKVNEKRDENEHVHLRVRPVDGYKERISKERK